MMPANDGFMRWIRLLPLALLLSGCALGKNPTDPFEPFNQSMYDFNYNIDTVAMKPIAVFYQKHTPNAAQTGIYNFFANLGDVWSAINNILQGNISNGLVDGMRFATNTVFGLFGLIDVATDAGMMRTKRDFGQTLGVWGLPPGPYVVLPVFGPSNLRDTIAFPFEWEATPWSYTPTVASRNVLSALDVVSWRASLLGTTNLIEAAALDPYQFTRDAYFQLRAAQVEAARPHFGKAPPSDDEGWSE